MVSCTQTEGGHGTINPAGPFNVEEDALMFRRAAVDGSGDLVYITLLDITVRFFSRSRSWSEHVQTRTKMSLQ